MKKIKVLSIIWGMIVVSVFVLLTTFGFVYKKKTTVYKELEEKLVESEKKYVDAKFLYPDSDEKVKTSASTLIEEGYLDELVANDETCDGYVIVSHDKTIFEYKGYIHCDKYTTKGYEK